MNNTDNKNCLCIEYLLKSLVIHFVLLLFFVGMDINFLPAFLSGVIVAYVINKFV